MTLRLLRVPLEVWERSSRHSADLLREFSLITLGNDPPDLPQRLLTLIEDMQGRYAGIGEQAQRDRLAALEAGQLTVDLDYQLPVQAVQLCVDLLELLRQADAFCDSGLLMTLPQPADQKQFNEWYLGEFVRQAGGEQPLPWPGSLD